MIFCDWVSRFSIDNWISLISAILIGGGTITLAIMTWKSIRHTRDIRESEKRQRLLGEIYDWAIYGYNEFAFPGLGDWEENQERMTAERLTYTITRGASASLKAEYIGGKLEKQVKEANAALFKLVGELKPGAEYKRLKGAKKDKYLAHMKELLGEILDSFQKVIISCSKQETGL